MYVQCTYFDDLVCHFQQYFRYIMAVNFIGGGNRNTRENHLLVVSH